MGQGQRQREGYDWPLPTQAQDKEYGGNCDAAVDVGTRVAERSIEKGVQKVR